MNLSDSSTSAETDADDILGQLEIRNGEWCYTPPQIRPALEQAQPPEKPPGNADANAAAFECVAGEWQAIQDSERIAHLTKVSKRIAISQ